MKVATAFTFFISMLISTSWTSVTAFASGMAIRCDGQPRSLMSRA